MLCHQWMGRGSFSYEEMGPTKPVPPSSSVGVGRFHLRKRTSTALQLQPRSSPCRLYFDQRGGRVSALARPGLIGRGTAVRPADRKSRPAQTQESRKGYQIDD